MSAHMLNDDEYQKIANFLYYQAITYDAPHGWDCKRFLGLDPSEDGFAHPSAEVCSDLVQTVVRNFYNLNRLALVTRYSEPYSREDEKRFKPFVSYGTTDKEIILLLRSLRYQCSEYIVSDVKWMDNLKAFIGELCENLFQQATQ